MMSRLVHQIIVFLVLNIYLAGSLVSSNSGDGEPQIRCKEAERQSLLKIKDNLHELKKGVLSSWAKAEENRECCEWIGIQCDNRTGHVISLDLSPSTFHKNAFFLSLRGNISSSLVRLENLNYLDLSSIDFDYNPIPSVIGTFSKLRYLNLSLTHLSGEVPRQLGKLSSLQVLDLNNNDDLDIKNLEWALHLSSLKVLDLSSINMSRAHDWVQVVNNLPFLTKLVLSDCNLPDSVASHLSLANSSKTLSFLDLSRNYGVSASIFQWLFNYNHTLVHLDLSSCSINTTIPVSFANLSSLQVLDLSYNDDLEIKNLEWALHLSSLKVLDLSFINMSRAHDWVQVVNNLPCLSKLVLCGCILPDAVASHLSLANSSKTLSFLDLSLNNDVSASIFQWLFNYNHTLVHLDLSSCSINTTIPVSFGNMSALEHLDLRSNMLEGEIPKSIWKICTLQNLQASGNNLGGELILPESPAKCTHFPLEYLDLSENRLTGGLPIFTLYSSLVELRLGSNQFNGSISKAHFSKLHKLRTLDLSSNSHINFNISFDPPFQLSIIYLQSCNLGPQFPSWLQTQTEILKLDISNSGISDSIPNWFWNLTTVDRQWIDLSNNEIRGTIQDDKHRGEQRLEIILDLSSNQLEGPVPIFFFHMASLDLSNNRFTDLNSLCNLSESTNLTYLDVSSNQLTGEIPDCWLYVEFLFVLNLANNKLEGKIPTSIGSLTWIWSLHLSNNRLTAELPLSFKNLTNLEVLDVGGNNLTGTVPAWIGLELTQLVVLSLRSNHFYGSIPSKICHLQYLQVLDLSSNSLSSSIPTCLANITAMKQIGRTRGNHGSFYNRDGNPYEELLLMWKGTENEFRDIWLLKNIDLSSNKLMGEIPREITELIGLNSLNLSRNNLSGQIPQEIGQLKSLDALDLSRNHLFGQIPPSLSQIDGLGVLDLSSNNLSGKIPTGTQLQARGADSYMDNPELCGAPLPKNCSDGEAPNPHGATKDGHFDQEDQDVFITKGFYVCAAIGFIVGFWGFCGTLIFHKSWRYRYLKFLESKGDWIYVTVAVHKAKLLRIIKS